MQIQIHSNNFDVTDGLRDHVSKRLAYALNHGRDMISRIVVRLADVNGPKGGIDKYCGIEIRLKGHSSITIEDIQTDLYIAIDRASERTGRTLDRRIARRPHFSSRRSTRHADSNPEMEVQP